MITIKKYNNEDLLPLVKKWLKREDTTWFGKHVTTSYIASKLNQVINQSSFNYVLYQNNNLIGYYCSYKIDDLLYNEPGLFTPAFAWYIKDKTTILRVFKVLYDDMKQTGVTHHIHQENNSDIDSILVDMGYGLHVKDAVTIVKQYDLKHHLTPITVNNIDRFYPLYKEHQLYMKNSPVFLDTDESKTACKNEIKDPTNMIFAFEVDGEWIGFTTLSTNKPAGSALFFDAATIALKGTHIKQTFQNKGYGRLLLKAIHSYAFTIDCNRIATDFESHNMKANWFWPKHFFVVAYTYVKYIGY